MADVDSVNDKATDGKAEGDKNKADDDSGKSELKTDNGLGIELGTKHDHEANDDKDNDEEDVGGVTSNFPEFKNGLLTVGSEKFGASASGNGGFGKTDALGDISQIVNRGKRLSSVEISHETTSVVSGAKGDAITAAIVGADNAGSDGVHKNGNHA